MERILRSFRFIASCFRAKSERSAFEGTLLLERIGCPARLGFPFWSVGGVVLGVGMISGSWHSCEELVLFSS